MKLPSVPGSAPSLVAETERVAVSSSVMSMLAVVVSTVMSASPATSVPLSVSVTVSVPSRIESSRTGTLTTTDVLPAGITAVPLTRVWSVPSAVPPMV